MPEEITKITGKEFFKKWLEKLQQESWQLELIISGFALFGIYSSRGILVDFEIMIQDIRGILSPLSFLLKVGWKIFFINLLIHVILRSLWIGAIGLRYVSGEIEYDEFNYSETFTQYLERKVGDYDDFIERLEKLCSVLFSYTFLLFLLFLSVIFFLICGMLPFIILEWLGIANSKENAFIVAIMGVLAIAYLLFGLIVFFDFITLGKIKKSRDRSLTKMYMPIYRFYSTITLSFLYRPLLYNFIDNRYTRRLFYFSIPYIIVIAFGNSIFSYVAHPYLASEDELRVTGLHLDPKYYDDLNYQRMQILDPEDASELKKLTRVRLSSYYMSQDFQYLFIKNYRHQTDLLNELHDLTQVYKPGAQFTLFGKSRMDISDVYNVSNPYVDEYNATDSIYLMLSEQIRTGEIDSLDLPGAIKRRDSLKAAISFIYQQKQTAKKNYQYQHYKEILDAMVDLTSMSIDGVPCDDHLLSCFYSKHPVSGDRGIICNLDIGDLSRGEHRLDVTLKCSFNGQTKEIDTCNYVLPFIKTY